MAAGTLLIALGVVGCGEPADDTGDASVAVASGYELEFDVVTGLDGPTQMIEGPDGRLWVAQLAGPEGAQQGQVVAVDVPSSSGTEVLLDGLDKPTGLAVLDGALWIQQRRSLLRASLREGEGGPAVGETELVLDRLPYNGRSEGTLTVTPDQTLLYETSGALAGDRAVEESGMLWELDPAAPERPDPIGTGLKNAYAHVFLDDGSLAITDVLEPLPGVEPQDEVNLLRVEGSDFGWPRCVNEAVPVTRFGATEPACRETVVPLALLGTGTTPTSVVVPPWDPGVVLLARWSARDVVRVPLAGGEQQQVLSFDGRPQHLLVRDDHVLVSDHATGRIHRLSRSS